MEPEKIVLPEIALKDYNTWLKRQPKKKLNIPQEGLENIYKDFGNHSSQVSIKHYKP